MDAALNDVGTRLEAHRRQVRLHCYRMTGSLHEADDLTQETLLRAWQKLSEFREESSLATWLYRIATNACLDFLRGRKNRVLPWGGEFPQYRTGADLPQPKGDVLWLEPFPDPEDQALRRERVSLAFLTLLQRLPPKPRAAVLLKDVLGYSSKETAEWLDLTPAAVNSALQRARAVLGDTAAPVPIDPSARKEIMDRFLGAWETGNAADIVAMMRDDTWMVMPPVPLWVQGPDDILRVLVDFPFRKGDPRRWKLVAVSGSNGQPAAGFYELDAQAGLYRPWGIQVLVLGTEPEGNGAFIAEYHVFKGPHLVAAFGLPATWPLEQ